MALIHEPEPVKLFVGMLSAYPEALAAAESALVEAFGPIDLRSERMPHEFTEYYRDVMGGPLVRYFVSMDRLVPPGDLARIKRLTNDFEARIAAAGPAAGVVEGSAELSSPWPVARPVNLDPGYIAPSKLVLASAKDFSHRIYLESGIYGEITLLYKRGQWKTQEWTFPDYRTESYHRFFDQVRARLMEQRRPV
jgi:hypothetical protein